MGNVRRPLSISRQARSWCLAAATLWLIANAQGARAADKTVIAESGDWQAIKSNDSCSIGIGSEAAFALFYFAQQNAFALDVTSPIPWRFPEGVAPAIRLATDGRMVLSRDDGALEYNVIQFVLSREDATGLLNKMANGIRMQAMFPNSNNDGGFISLSGSGSVISAFSRCFGEKLGRASAVSASPDSPAPTFGVSFDAFRKSLDDKIREDTRDKSQSDFSTTNLCRRAENNYACDFHDAGFQSTVVSFKKIDVLNGRFTLKLRLVVETADAKVSRITLSSDRADIINLFQFIGTVENVMQTFDPTVGREAGESARIADELGLMRGDDANDIGKSREMIKPYAEIECISQDSHVTTQVECQFVPRS